MSLPRTFARPSFRIGLVAAAALLAFPIAPAHAEDIVKTAERLNKKAMDDYDNLEFDSAKQTLQGAIAKLREAGQDETPTAARIYVNLGIVYFTADKDRSRAINQFVEALKIDGTMQLDPERGTPEIQELFAEAQKKAPKPATPRPPKPEEIPTDEPPPGDTTAHSGIVHDSVDTARPGQDVLIRATMGDDVNATKLFVFYRSGGQEDYQSVGMTRGRRGEYVGTIPGDAVVGKSMQYYIEARDARNRPAVSSGTAASPYIISLGGGGGGGDVEVVPGLVPKRPEDPGRGYGRMFFNLMVGTGLGVQLGGNQYEVAYVYNGNVKAYVPLTVQSSGVASSPLHGALEIGVNINRHIALSLIGRLEGTLINNADSSDPAATAMGFGDGSGTAKATTAAAGLLRFRYNFGEGRLHPGLHLGIGGGQIRHVLDITGAASADYPLVDAFTAQHYSMNNQDPYAGLAPHKVPAHNDVCLDKNPCYDDIAIGYILTSVGGSIYYDLTTWKNGGFGIIADFAALFAFGGQFGINFDLQLGIGGHFL